MSQGHPYRRLHLPDDAPFELKPSPGKGWGAFTTRRIERGSIILREKPLFIIRKPNQEILGEDIWAAVLQLGPREKEQFFCLRDNGSRLFMYLTTAFAENSFDVSENCQPPSGGSPKHGLYLLHSRFNHSCIPNAKAPDNPRQELITSIAVRDIDAGQEITICYNTDFEGRARHERHQALRFVCECKACLADTRFQQLSDMRRILIRGLHYLTHGEDLYGHEQQTASPIISNPDLRKAAENFQIPISARLIYTLLIMALLEEEGLLDNFRVERLNRSISLLCTCFKTEENARIARLVTSQETCMEKLCTALKLDGRTDVADHEISMLLRMIKDRSV